MSLRSTAKALPTALRISFSEAIAYRAEMLVWVLATTMPLVMMALWTAVAREAPIGGYGQKDFVAYFLATFIVRQLSGSWAAWQINFEVRQGTLSMRLLRPFHPILAWALEHLAAIPMRIIVAIPVAGIMLASVGAGALPHSVAMWGVWVLAVIGGWAITFLVGVTIGALAFFMEQSLKIMDVWLATFFVLSGYLIPISLFPPQLARIVNWLPWRFQIGFAVEVMTGRHDWPETLTLLARQWGWVAIFATLAFTMWRVGVKRFAAYGG